MAEILYRTSTTPSVPGSTTAKGTPLTNLEIDGNFKSIANDLLLKAPLQSPTFTGDVTVNSTTALKLPAGTEAQRPTPVTGMLRFNNEAVSFEGYDGSEWGAIGGGGGVTYVTHTTNYTAVAGDGIMANTSGGTFTVTLPAAPAAGDYVYLADVSNWETNNLNVARNGSTIEGVADDLVLDSAGLIVQLLYNGTTWEVFPQSVGGPTYTLLSGAKRQTFSASGGQTTFTVTYGYAPGLIDVYLNGIKLVNGTDVTVTSGTDIVLAAGATAGDVVEVVSYSAYGVADSLPLTGGAMTGTITFGGSQTFPLTSNVDIKTINSTSLVGSGDVAVQPTLVSGTNIKTINSTSLLGSGDVAVQPTLVSGTNIKTVNGGSILGSGDLTIDTSAFTNTTLLAQIQATALSF